MSEPPNNPALPEGLRDLAEAVVSLHESPAAIVFRGEVTLAQNAQWDELVGGRASSEAPPTLRQSLCGFTSAEALVAALQSGSESTGLLSLYHDSEHLLHGEPVRAEYTVRWRQIQLPRSAESLALVDLHHTSEAEHMASIVSSQRIQINKLLIHQTLIEEAERRRLSRVVHDGIIQSLAQIRATLTRLDCSTENASVVLGAIDRVVEEARTLTFELSPPVLEDFGLVSALQWLGEHLAERFDARVSVVAEGDEPRLPHDLRTIVFRAVRELTINAAKHVPGAQIAITCHFGHDDARFVVSDSGPGFDVSGLLSKTAASSGFGLRSVEQQVRSLGGSFELVSGPGTGTAATVKVPIENESDHT